jgi:hypothetical protein
MEEDRFCIVLIGIKNEEITRRQMSYRPDMVKYRGDIFIRQWSNGPNERGEEEFYYKRVSLSSLGRMMLSKIMVFSFLVFLDWRKELFFLKTLLIIFSIRFMSLKKHAVKASRVLMMYQLTKLHFTWRSIGLSKTFGS